MAFTTKNTAAAAGSKLNDALESIDIFLTKFDSSFVLFTFQAHPTLSGLANLLNTIFKALKMDHTYTVSLGDVGRMAGNYNRMVAHFDVADRLKRGDLV